MAQNPFEVPQQVREIAEKNLDQARAAYGQFMDTMMEAWSQATSKFMPPNDTIGFKAVQDKATEFAKQNAEAALALSRDLAKAKDILEVLAIQRLFAQTQMQAYASQAQELGQLMAGAMHTIRPAS